MATTDKQYFHVQLNILDALGHTTPATITVPAQDAGHAREVARYTAVTNWPTAQGFNITSVSPLSPEENARRNAQLTLFE